MFFLNTPQNQLIISKIQISENISELEKLILEEFNAQKLYHQFQTEYGIGQLTIHKKNGWTNQPVIILDKLEYNNQIGQKKIIQWSQKYLTRNITTLETN